MRPVGIPKSITLEQSESIKRYMQEVKNYAPLSKSEELETIKKAQAGCDKSRTKIIHHNLRFVISIAKGYQYGYGEMILNDLIQLGNIGVIHAINRFDTESNLKFITFAVWWIRKIIMDEMEQYNAPIKYPQNFYTSAAKIRRIKAQLEQDLEYTPSQEQVMDVLPESEHRVLAFGDLYTGRFVHLDKPLEGNNGINGQETTMNDYLSDADAVATDASMDTDDHDYMLETLLKSLNERELHVIRASTGMGADPCKVKEIAVELGITTVRVRQIIGKAMKKMQAKAVELNFQNNF